MKLLPVLSASVALGLSACDTMNAPISSSGFDPLLAPGGNYKPVDSRPAFRAGDLARAIMDNTFFFKQLPKGEADADKTLLRGTNMKVIRVSGSYLQVELDASGEVGYVPAVMVENASLQPVVPMPPGSIYPPLPGGADGINPVPPLNPGVQPPGGTIPTVIDPNVPIHPAPGTEVAPPAPPPAVTSPTDPAVPVQPKVEIPEKPNPEAPAGGQPEVP